jgi:hypothetical protein
MVKAAQDADRGTIWRVQTAEVTMRTLLQHHRYHHNHHNHNLRRNHHLPLRPYHSPTSISPPLHCNPYHSPPVCRSNAVLAMCHPGPTLPAILECHGFHVALLRCSDMFMKAMLPPLSVEGHVHPTQTSPP